MHSILVSLLCKNRRTLNSAERVQGLADPAAGYRYTYSCALAQFLRTVLGWTELGVARCAYIQAGKCKRDPNVITKWGARI